MDCSIMNCKVHLHLQDSTTSLNLLIDNKKDGNSRSLSALQDPETRKLELAAMLRKALKKQQSRKSQSSYWTRFLTSYVGQNANSNDA